MKTITMKRECSHSEGPGHDCAYVDWRNGMVEAAAAVADVRHGAEPPGGDRFKSEEAMDNDPAASKWAARWSATFHREMAHLTADPFRRGGRGGDILGGAEVEYSDAEADADSDEVLQ